MTPLRVAGPSRTCPECNLGSCCSPVTEMALICCLLAGKVYELLSLQESSQLFSVLTLQQQQIPGPA